jgi:beta-phosphoglucomutase-like phosphatase (HAD superfamily)
MGSQIEAVFIDDGGVISDNRRRAVEWQRLVGEFFSPRLGGPAALWARANRELVGPVWAELFSVPLAGRPYRELYERYLVRWLGVMCQAVGVPTPALSEALALATEATLFVTSSASSAFPRVANAIERLVQVGLPLHTASGGPSWELEGYLRSAGVRQHFGLLFGVDLAGELKGVGTEYYRQIFCQAGVDPLRALVVDDNNRSLAQAEELGATTVIVTAEDQGLNGAVDRVLSVLS